MTSLLRSHFLPARLVALLILFVFVGCSSTGGDASGAAGTNGAAGTSGAAGTTGDCPGMR